jgi:hypothetical protein
MWLLINKYVEYNVGEHIAIMEIMTGMNNC